MCYAYFYVTKLPHTMKTLLNLLRAAVFLVAVYYLLAFFFYVFGWLGINAAILIENWKERMSAFLFWMLFLFIGIAVLSLAWSLFRIAIGFIMAFVGRICPYRKFAVWSTGLMAVLYTSFFLYGFWFLGGELRVSTVILGIVLTVLSIQLCLFLVKGILVGYEAMDEGA